MESGGEIFDGSKISVVGATSDGGRAIATEGGDTLVISVARTSTGATFIIRQSDLTTMTTLGEHLMGVGATVGVATAPLAFSGGKKPAPFVYAIAGLGTATIGFFIWLPSHVAFLLDTQIGEAHVW